MQTGYQHNSEEDGGTAEMIIKKKVAAICKKSKNMLLATSKDKTQWVGQGTAFYSIAGLPEMTVPEVMTALDYTDDEKAKFTGMAPIDLGKSISDTYPEEILADEIKAVYHNAIKYLMIKAGGRVILINSEYLIPVKHEAQTSYYVRFKENGDAFLCVKVGMLAEAIVMDSCFTEPEIKTLIDGMRRIETSILNGYAPYLETKDGGADGEQMEMGDNEEI